MKAITSEGNISLKVRSLIKNNSLKLMFCALIIAIGFNANAQKYALIDSEYILKNIPAYEAAQDQLDKASEKWSQEVDILFKEVENLYKQFQNDLVFMSDELKVKKENEIVTKENAAKDLKKKYFGPECELFKKRESLIGPIQEELYNAVKEIADADSYAVIFDKSRNPNIIYANPKFDISDKVLEKLGYSK